MRIDLSETNFDATADIDDTQMKVNISQTDESKVAEQQSSSRLQQCTSSKPRIRCVADTGVYINIYIHDFILVKR